MNKSSIDVDVAPVLLLRLQLTPLPGLSYSDVWSDQGAKSFASSLLWWDSAVGPKSNVQQSECLISTWTRGHPCAPMDIEHRFLRWSWAGQDRDVLVDGGSSSEVMGWLKTKVGDTTLDCDLCQYLSLVIHVRNVYLVNIYPYLVFLFLLSENTPSKPKTVNTLILNTLRGHLLDIIYSLLLYIQWQ